MKNRSLTARENVALVSGIILNFDYGKFFNELTDQPSQNPNLKRRKVYFGEEWKHREYSEARLIGAEKSGIYLPHPLRSLDIALWIEDGKKLSGKTNIDTASILGAGCALEKNLSVEAERRNSFWADGGSSEGNGYLLPEVRIGQYSQCLAILNSFKKGNRLRYEAGIGLDNCCRATTPLRNEGDFKLYVEPLIWISETIINTYIELAREKGIRTLGKKSSPIMFNISP